MVKRQYVEFTCIEPPNAWLIEQPPAQVWFKHRKKAYRILNFTTDGVEYHVSFFDHWIDSERAKLLADNYIAGINVTHVDLGG